MDSFHLDFHGLDYQLHSDLEDELMGGELPCPLQAAAPGRPETGRGAGAEEREDFEDLENLDDLFDLDDPDDPDHAGYPEDDEGSCEDSCDDACGLFGDEFMDDGEEDPDDLFQDEDPEDDGAPEEQWPGSGRRA